MSMKAEKKYKPSNGTECVIFTDTYCMNCLYCDPNPKGEKQCDIMLSSLIFDIKDKEYPKEWVYINDKPSCTKWSKWDWVKDGNPDDVNNQKESLTYDPNQLELEL